MATPVDLARDLHLALEARSVPHAIGGALALAFYAEPRATKDVDVNVFVTDAALSPIFDALDSLGASVDRDEASRTARDRGDFVAWKDGYRLDFFVSFHAFHDEVRRRTRVINLAGTALPILSAEDLMIFKVLFDRPKDWIDITGIAAGRRSLLDRDHVRRWLSELLSSEDERLARLEEILERTR